jgi:hypothetical protein
VKFLDPINTGPRIIAVESYVTITQPRRLDLVLPVDDTNTVAGIVAGGSGQVSTEYGSGTKPSGFADKVGNSAYHAATDWETALGIFVNGACAATCVNMAINGVATGFGNVAPGSVISNAHCHSQYQSGLIDNQAAIDNICKTVTVRAASSYCKTSKLDETGAVRRGRRRETAVQPALS